MKYIAIELQTSAGGVVGNIVSAYDTKEQAESKFHAILSAAAVSNIPTHAAILIDSDGNVLDSGCYKHQAQ